MSLSVPEVELNGDGSGWFPGQRAFSASFEAAIVRCPEAIFCRSITCPDMQRRDKESIY